MTDEDKFALAVSAFGKAVVKQIPVAGALVDFAEAMAKDKDQQHLMLLANELHDHVNRLQSKLDGLEKELAAHGQKLEELGPVRIQRLIEESLHAYASAMSDTKRDALENAVVRQFDPRAGTQAFRRYWFEVAKQMSDAEIEALRVISTHNGAVYYSREGHRFLFGASLESVQNAAAQRRENALQRIPLSADEVTAVRDLLWALGERDRGLVVRLYANGRPAPSAEQAVIYALTHSGAAVAGMIDDIPSREVADATGTSSGTAEAGA